MDGPQPRPELYDQLYRQARAMLNRCVAEGRDLNFEELLTFERIERTLDAIVDSDPHCWHCGQRKLDR